MTDSHTIRRLGGAFDGTIALVRLKIDAMKEAAARRRMYRATRDELWALSDRDLSDLGIPRSDILRLAREAAYGR